MGYFAEYMKKQMSFDQLIEERKKQLKKISQARNNRPVLVYASDFNKAGTAPIDIRFEDKLPFEDACDTIEGNEVDVIIETLGGSADVVHQLVKILRRKFESVEFIVPGMAMSAGTIFVLSGDEIWMTPSAQLGPIDAQITYQGKPYSAHAFLEKLRKMEKKVEKDGKISLIYIPMLRNMNLGEIQQHENALECAKKMVREWLPKYKFKNWNTHSSTGEPVTDKQKKLRAAAIARKLCSQKIWKSHGRGLNIDDLEDIGLKIKKIEDNVVLFEAVQRYYALLRHTFETAIFKIFETKDMQTIQSFGPLPQPIPQIPQGANLITADFTCPRCKTVSRIQANFEKNIPVMPGAILFPEDNKFTCPNCGLSVDLQGLGRLIESQSGKQIIK